MSKKTSWIHHPTKKQLSIVMIVYVIASVCSVAAMSDLFSEFIDVKKYIILLILLFLSTATMLQVTFNYFRQKI